eukprot:3922675-Amphidinium_carterae.1
MVVRPLTRRSRLISVLSGSGTDAYVLVSWSGRCQTMWDNALRAGRGRGPTRNLKQLVERLGWMPPPGGWICNGQWLSWDEATLRAKWDSAQ